ncbi:MAG: DUF2339 domain-containing protein [Pseudomonadales bacterium]|nr:DUF2339 domain-containing protein [Pseudomonadales bacterium]
MEFIGALLALTVLVGSILGFVAFKIAADQRTQIRHLRWRLDQLAQRLGARDFPDEPASSEAGQNVIDQDNDTATTAQPPLCSSAPEVTRPVQQPTQAQTNSRTTPREPGARSEWAKKIDELTNQIKANWMVWLGGVSLGLAGVFLAIYSIEQGLLSPAARIVLGIVAGIAMLAIAEYLRRKQSWSSSVFAALAAAGSITLFASILSAHQLYDLINANVAFGLLALVGLVTMGLAILHGPVLAGLGLLGAYTVPILVSTGSNNALGALLYATIITASASGLLRFVHRNWLWWGVAVGSLGWWLLTIELSSADGWRGIYLTVSAYFLLAMPSSDWGFTKVSLLEKTSYHPSTWLRSNTERDGFRFSILFLAAIATSAISEADLLKALQLWLPPLALMMLASRSREPLNVIPWLLVVLVLASTLWLQLDPYQGRLRIETLAAGDIGSLLTLLGTISVTTTLWGVWSYSNSRFKALWAAFATMPTALCVCVGYVLLDMYVGQWIIAALALGLTYIGLAIYCIDRKLTRDSALLVSLFFAGHFAIATAAAIAFTPDALTLVIAAQLVSAAWLMNRFEVDLAWMVKVLASLLIVRLTLNPWFIDYPTGTHWTLWTYGGSAILSALGWWTLGHKIDGPNASAKKWLEGATLHLIILALWTELRYWVHDGNVFVSELNSVEVALYVVLFGAISVVYYRRSLASETIAWLYRMFTTAATAAALASYGVICLATTLSLSWVYQEIGTTPVLNLGLVYFGLPILIAYAIYLYGEPIFRTAAKWVAAVAAFVFVNVEIRHLWNATFDLSERVSQGEMVTFSIVWLTMAITILIYASGRGSLTIYRTGMALLALTIAKIFLVDMADLTGLLRVVSFFGLGLALLGLSFLHQRLDPSVRGVET